MIPPIDPNLNIVRNGLVLWLDPKFQTSYPSSGSTWFDLSGNDLDMTFTNIGSGIIYNTSNGNNFQYAPNTGRCSRTYVSGDEYDLGITGKMSLEFWIKYDTLVRSLDGGIVFGLLFGNHTAGHMQWQFFKHIFGSPSKYYLAWCIYNTSQHRIVQYYQDDPTYPPPVPLVANTWYHIVCYFDNSNGNIGMYIDGVGGAGQTFGSVLSSIPLPGVTFRSLNIGCNRPGSTNYQMDGNIGTLRIYDRVLSAEEVLHNYNQQKIRFGK